MTRGVLRVCIVFSQGQGPMEKSLESPVGGRVRGLSFSGQLVVTQVSEAKSSFKGFHS